MKKILFADPDPAVQTPDQRRKIIQNQLDQGGSWYMLPGPDSLKFPGRYVIDRPLIIDQDKEQLFADGDVEIYNSRSGSAVMLGIKRKSLSADHWPGNGAIRTCGDSRVFFQCSPFSQQSSQLTIQCQVTANKGWSTDQTPLFGSMYNLLPGPWYCNVGAGVKLGFVFRLAGDLKPRQAVFPMSGTNLQFTININLVTGLATAIVNGVTYPFPPGLIPVGAQWYPAETELFQIGAIGDGLTISPYDLTFTQLSVNGFSLWKDTAAGDWAVHAFGPQGQAQGVFTGPIGTQTWVAGNRLEGIQFTAATGWGQAVGIGPIQDCLLDNVYAVNGRHNVGSIPAAVSYTLKMRDCVLSTPRDVNLRLDSATLSSLATTLKYPARAAAILRGSGGSLYDTEVTDTPADNIFVFLDNRGGGGEWCFKGGFVDCEGQATGALHPLSYFNFEQHADTPVCYLRVEDMALGRLNANGSHFLLRKSELAQAITPSQCRLWYSGVSAVNDIRVSNLDTKVDGQGNVVPLWTVTPY